MSSCVCKILFKSEQICGCCCKMLRGSLFGTHGINALLRRCNWHSAGSLGWPFQMLKYKYIFQIKYAEAILSNNTRKLLWFEISKRWLQFWKVINLLCRLFIIYLLFSAHFRSLCLKTSVISCVLNANSGRYTDASVSYTNAHCGLSQKLDRLFYTRGWGCCQ